MNHQNIVNGKTGDNDVNIKLNNYASKFQLSVQQNNNILDWKGDTLAIVTWLNSKSSIRSKAISSSTGWDIEQKSVEHGYQLKCRQKDLGFSININSTSKDDLVTVSTSSSGNTFKYL